MVEITPECNHQLSLKFESAFPLECCGFLLGRKEESHSIVTRVVETFNPVKYKGGFEIPDHELRRVRLIASRENLNIIALFHSHPDGITRLSKTDQATKAYSDWLWIILTKNSISGNIVLTCYT